MEKITLTQGAPKVGADFFVISLDRAKRSSKKTQRPNNSVRQRDPKPQTSGERGTTLETGRLRELHTESHSPPAPLAGKNQPGGPYPTPPAQGIEALAAVPHVLFLGGKQHWFDQSESIVKEVGNRAEGPGK